MNHRPDPDEREKIKSMCRYMKDDDRIAKYTGFPESTIATIRRSMGEGKGSGRPVDYQPPREGNGMDELTSRRINATRGSAHLLSAIQRMGG